MPTKSRATATRSRMLNDPEYRRRVLAALANDTKGENTVAQAPTAGATAEVDQ